MNYKCWGSFESHLVFPWAMEAQISSPSSQPNVYERKPKYRVKEARHQCVYTYLQQIYTECIAQKWAKPKEQQPVINGPSRPNF